MDLNNDQLKLENQLCFPLYASAKEVVKRYKPYLDEIGLTYTQYLAMMVLWEHKTINVKKMGEYLYLDSGTLTPLLKRLELIELIERNRDPNDERNVIIKLTPKGEALKKPASQIPDKVKECLPITQEEIITLYHILYKLLGTK
ncbi:MarR family transcriptional regulator [Acetobacterium wieringae]|nr:MarR family transcriptional regulator [Acetobacterium wieringae]